MLGEILTGLSADERTPIELASDKGEVKTKWMVLNAPSWVDLEVGRIAHQWDKAGYDEGHALSYAWVSMCLVGIRSLHVVDDTIEIPRSESFTTRTGERAMRIPLEWLVKTFGKRYRILDELSTAIYAYNHLSASQRKNWTWQGESITPVATGLSPASVPAAVVAPANPVSGADVAHSDSTPASSETGVSTTDEK
jgi:hypothetical protein